MAKSKYVDLRYTGYLQHYEKAAHVQTDGTVDRGPTPAEKYACTERIVDDLDRRGVESDTLVFNYNNNFTAKASREAAEWLITNEPGEWEIVGDEQVDDEVEQSLNTEAG